MTSHRDPWARVAESMAPLRSPDPGNLMGPIVHCTLTGRPAELDALLRPRSAFGYRINDNCERRAHLDSGEFLREWGALPNNVIRQAYWPAACGGASLERVLASLTVRSTS